jgi:hypothetical protein
MMLSVLSFVVVSANLFFNSILFVKSVWSTSRRYSCPE